MSWISVELYRKGMVKIGSFKLSSGVESPFYIDLRRLYMHPELAKAITLELIRVVGLSDVDAVVGVATAGIPLAAYVSCLTGKPMAYVRSERKNHGTNSLIEGDVSGLRVLVVDDVSTTGSSILRAIEAVREAGGTPMKAGVIVDREQGARGALARHGVELYWLTTARRIFQDIYMHGLITEAVYRSVIEYLDKYSVVEG
ncbi:orotate phosphoribosyltransferase [Desulfurococcus mucosus]|uniref:Orotate phosphoribosyltransferase n=1 Tax=Desulfurococcus mucosus (strain ATCC 35584 / DSM 2162 / JCM 9187 / O7/1) TaxID=765177 RepID=E8R8P7_DESM0|nr:orotate phosphoribosyltransferase [Desulfurococcus mucosus]ADV64873.1 orotate phosphoribosyltransferase [Desulfurococcus mucosus DSM 2162]